MLHKREPRPGGDRAGLERRSISNSNTLEHSITELQEQGTRRPHPRRAPRGTGRRGWAMTRREVFVDELPRVAEAEALDDQSWFDKHPGRRFRGRRGSDGFFWIIRRRGEVLLRTVMRQPATPPEDVDRELAGAFFRAAYPGAPVAEVQRCARKALSRRMDPYWRCGRDPGGNAGGDGGGK